ncbi:unnamed protein product [Arctogadus glacialis]
MHSAVKQNYHLETEADLNKLVNVKLAASYTYLALGMYFDRDDVALPKFSQYFMERATKEQEQAEQLLQYQNMRGGRVVLQSISKPIREEWKGGLDALTFSLDYQKTLNSRVLDLHRRADGHKDPHLCDFLETHFLADSHVVIKQLGDYMGSLGRLCATEAQAGMGEYLFDKHTL